MNNTVVPFEKVQQLLGKGLQLQHDCRYFLGAREDNPDLSIADISLLSLARMLRESSGLAPERCQEVIWRAAHDLRQVFETFLRAEPTDEVANSVLVVVDSRYVSWCEGEWFDSDINAPCSEPLMPIASLAFHLNALATVVYDVVCHQQTGEEQDAAPAEPEGEHTPAVD